VFFYRSLRPSPFIGQLFDETKFVEATFCGLTFGHNRPFLVVFQQFFGVIQTGDIACVILNDKNPPTLHISKAVDPFQLVFISHLLPFDYLEFGSHIYTSTTSVGVQIKQTVGS
jgi:hypothetical protein